MNILVLYLLTVFFSVVTKAVSVAKLFKDYMCDGFILNIKNNNCPNGNGYGKPSQRFDNMEIIKSFIPLYNIYDSFAFYKTLEECYIQILQNLKVEGVLDEMNAEEIVAFKNNTNLLLMILNRAINNTPENFEYRIFIKDDKYGKKNVGSIYFKLEQDTIKILSKTGIAKKFSYELTLAYIQKSLDNIEKDESVEKWDLEIEDPEESILENNLVNYLKNQETQGKIDISDDFTDNEIYEILKNFFEEEQIKNAANTEKEEENVLRRIRKK